MNLEGEIQTFEIIIGESSSGSLWSTDEDILLGKQNLNIQMALRWTFFLNQVRRIFIKYLLSWKLFQWVMSLSSYFVVYGKIATKSKLSVNVTLIIQRIQTLIKFLQSTLWREKLQFHEAIPKIWLCCQNNVTHTICTIYKFIRISHHFSNLFNVILRETKYLFRKEKKKKHTFKILFIKNFCNGDSL